MKTYQDLLEIGENDGERIDFVRRVINEFKASELYREGVVAYEYAAKKNVTIRKYQKLLYTVSGKAVPDNYSANWKTTSAFFHRFVTQETQFLLGNGISWSNDGTAEKLGKNFDIQLQKLGKDALIGGCAFGFWNLDHLDVFNVKEFAPLYDEENGALMAGVRFWQLSPDKPLRATLYEMDGYTEFLWKGKYVPTDTWTRMDADTYQIPKRAYILKTRTTEADGTEIYDYENYPGFPIVPMWGNPNRQSELVGIRESIDCYDLIKSGFANDLDDASQIYWLIQNAGGMDDVDLAEFIRHMKTVKAAVVEDQGAKAEAHTVEVPFEGKETLLTRLSKDLYRDAMALDTAEIAGGAVTATQILAAYEPLNSKTDDFEYCVHDFLGKVLALAGIADEKATFTRSMLLNKSEEIDSVMKSASNLPADYVTRKIVTILGDGDMADEVIEQMHAEELDKFKTENSEFGNDEGDEEEE